MVSGFDGPPPSIVVFDVGEVLIDDDHLAGGYGLSDDRVRTAVSDGWRRGLPLDHTYTGKAMAGLLSRLRGGSVSGDVIFWHTGGFMTEVAHIVDSSAGGVVR